MTMRWWAWVLGAACSVAVLSAGCDVFDESLAPPEEPDAGTFESGCDNGSEEPPEPPPDSEDGETKDWNGDGEANDDDELVLALKDVVLSDGSAGLNVDERCTSLEGPWGCLPEDELARLGADAGPPEPPVDMTRGKENVFSNEVFDTVNLVFESGAEGQDLELTSQTAEAKGQGNPVIRIRDYNGEPNDPQVTVIVSQSVFGVRSDDGMTKPDICIWDTGGPEGGVAYQPTMDCNGGMIVDSEPTGSDPIGPLDVTIERDMDGNPVAITSVDDGWAAGDIFFWGRQDTFAGGDESRPVVIDDRAYVTDDKLVVRLPNNVLFKLVGEGQAVQARLTDAFAIGQIARDETGNITGSTENGVLVAGRWSITALLETAQSVGVCPGDPLFGTATNLLAGFADVRSDPSTEAEDARCDAVSFGITFTAFRGHWGGLAPGQPIPNPCETDGGI